MDDHESKPELTRREILRKLTPRCLSNNPNISSNIEAIRSSATIQDWVRELPSITDNLLTVLGAFDDIEVMVTKEFIFEYYFKSLVEDEQPYPEIDVIAELADLEQYAENQGGYESKFFPIESVKQLNDHYERLLPRLKRF